METKGSECIRFDCHLQGNIPLVWPWTFPCCAGAGRILGIQAERGVQGGHTEVFFLIPKDQAGYSSEVLVTGIKRNCYFDNSGLLEINKEKSLLYIKRKVFNGYLCKCLVSTSLRARLIRVSLPHPECRPGLCFLLLLYLWTSLCVCL